jgi:murein DD-endopeptidase MepM/ murein hydrolase activator NlpD
MSPVAPKTLFSAVSRAAVLTFLAATAAGCSGNIARFGQATDGPLYTGSIGPTGGANAMASASPTVPPIAAAPTGRVETAAIAPIRPASTPASKAPTVTTNHGQWAAGTTNLVVQPGDTVYGIASRYGVPADALMSVNGISDASAVQVGQTLVLPAFSAGGGQSKVATAPSTPSSPDTAGSRYTVSSGDTLYGVARRHNVSAAALANANGLDTSASLRIGQSLVLPGGSAPVTQQPVQVASLGSQVAVPAGRAVAVASQPLESPSPAVTPAPAPVAEKVEPVVVQPVAYTPPSAAAQTVEKAAAQDTSLPEPDAMDTGKFRWPARGRIVSEFGRKTNGVQNDGINLAVPEGTSVRAAENGVVAYAGNELKGYGNLVLIRHADDYVTAYAHNSELLVKRGDQITRGQIIAKAGQTGSVTSPQLHFEVRKGSRPVDPLQYLAAR